MGAGKVDYKNLWKNEQERQKHIRWRTLKMFQTGAMVSIYGYATHIGGPWFGYTLVDLLEAPCVHCGQVGFFRPESWIHECLGIYDGHRLPCSEGIPKGYTSHPCKGEPSMAYHGVPFWKSTDWFEVETVSK